MSALPPTDALGSAHTVRLILGDQLNAAHPWWSDVDAGVVTVLVECRQETDYARHHIQKVLAFFLAMRGFSAARAEEGHRMHHVTIDQPDALRPMLDVVHDVVVATGATRFEHQLPDEWRLDELLRTGTADWGVEVLPCDTHHFLTQRDDLATHFKGKKQYLMESFYRMMRKRHAVLLDGAGQPEGGKWNYDANNRKKLPKGHVPPQPKLWPRDVAGLIAQLEDAGVQTVGRVDPTAFGWPVTREESVELLGLFVDELLPLFGDFQDALTEDSWTVYHSRLSFAMNVKMLSPREVIEVVERKWREAPSHASIAQVEGFIRQILGWREYMRGVYWAHMPEYAEKNFFQHDRPLPGWFWTGETGMRCLQHAITQTLDHAYAHHIQRLMVTGNFALLAGIDPDEVDGWYLGVYIDAIEWVEITNTRGMSQFADGGIVGTKPYVSSANYMHKMGPHCAGCRYNRQGKTEDDACPFNSLYWHFHARNRHLLEKNPRIGMVYRTWDKMDPAKQQALLDRGDAVLHNLEQL